MLGAVAVPIYFFIPGALLMKLLWPEWRIRGDEGVERLAEIIAGGVVMSATLTILVGFYLGNVGLFWVGTSEPLLEAILGGLSVLFFVIGFFRGAYSESPPRAPSLVEGPLGGEIDTEAYYTRLEEISKKERRLRHELRKAGMAETPERERLQTELAALLEERKEILKERNRVVSS